jgi:undecaprenyl-diphosphatase
MSAVVLSSKEDLQTLLEIYDTAPRPILVHCLGGADRTGEASALWVLEVQKKSKAEALKQLAITYGHRKYVNSAKDFLIQIWGGREWLATTYRPDDYPWFCRPINE